MFQKGLPKSSENDFREVTVDESDNESIHDIFIAVTSMGNGCERFSGWRHQEWRSWPKAGSVFVVLRYSSRPGSKPQKLKKNTKGSRFGCKHSECVVLWREDKTIDILNNLDVHLDSHFEYHHLTSSSSEYLLNLLHLTV